MKNDCAYKDKCMTFRFIQILAISAGRFLSYTPFCEDCDIYKPVERKEKK